MTGAPMERGGLRERLRERRAEVLAAAARRGASNLRIFGSDARGDDDAGSDVDFPVDVVEVSTLRPGDEDVLADAVELESA